MVGAGAMCTGVCVLPSTGSVSCHQDRSDRDGDSHEMDRLCFPIPHAISSHYSVAGAQCFLLATVEMVLCLQASQEARAVIYLDLLNT